MCYSSSCVRLPNGPLLEVLAATKIRRVLLFVIYPPSHRIYSDNDCCTAVPPYSSSADLCTLNTAVPIDALEVGTGLEMLCLRSEPSQVAVTLSVQQYRGTHLSYHTQYLPPSSFARLTNRSLQRTGAKTLNRLHHHFTAIKQIHAWSRLRRRL